MTPEDLQAIRERAERATKGPWKVGWEGTWIEGPDPNANVIADIVPRGNDNDVSKAMADEDHANAELMAHARTDIPLLLDSLSRLRTERDNLLAFVKDFVNIGCHHACTDDSCSVRGQQRMLQAKELLHGVEGEGEGRNR